MNRFAYTRVTDVESAVREISSPEEARFIAGGTNLLDLMKVNVMRPEKLVDISQLALKTIEETPNGGLRLGALATNADTAYNEHVVKRYPLLSEAMLSAASAQLRNMATNGGNLLQRTRCYYFYDTTTACNKREPGTGCSAINGFNRLHAILGTSESCIATHPSDMAVALTALDAEVNVVGNAGPRTIPMLEFHRLPGDAPHLDSNLSPDEVITSITLPPQGLMQHYRYLKLRDRPSYAFALVSVAVAVELEGDHIRDIRLALGGVAHKPWRKPDAEFLLKDKPVAEADFQKAAEILLEGAQGYGSNNFKIELAKRALIRAVNEALKIG
jgi:xanthine dehydrogenase YagS FAD-binding subunit